MAATAYARLVRVSGNSSSMRGGGVPVPDATSYGGVAATPVTVDATHSVFDVEVPAQGVLPSDLMWEVTLTGADGENGKVSFSHNDVDPNAETDTDFAIAFVNRPNYYAATELGQKCSIVALS
jgi:hypothetical protein